MNQDGNNIIAAADSENKRKRKAGPNLSHPPTVSQDMAYDTPTTKRAVPYEPVQVNGGTKITSDLRQLRIQPIPKKVTSIDEIMLDSLSVREEAWAGICSKLSSSSIKDEEQHSIKELVFGEFREICRGSQIAVVRGRENLESLKDNLSKQVEATLEFEKEVQEEGNRLMASISASPQLRSWYSMIGMLQSPGQLQMYSDFCYLLQHSIRQKLLVRRGLAFYQHWDALLDEFLSTEGVTTSSSAD
jgi:hypothetical protein